MGSILLARLGGPCGIDRVQWTDLPVHVIDFEGSLRTGIVEAGCVVLRGGELLEFWTRTCRARASIPGADQAVHGLNDDDLENQEPFEAEWSRFARWREEGLFAAHFAATENGLLRSVWPCPRLSPDFLNRGVVTAQWGPWIDTGRIAAQGGEVNASLRLEDLVQGCGLLEQLNAMAAEFCPADRRRFHCAGYDAIACALLLDRFARDPGGEAWSLVRVLEASTADPRAREQHRQIELF